MGLHRIYFAPSQSCSRECIIHYRVSDGGRQDPWQFVLFVSVFLS